MLKRLFPCLALLCLVAVPIQARAADPVTTPDLVIQVQSIDSSFAHMKYLANLTDRGDQAKLIEALVRSSKVIDGIDTKEPFGLYATFATSDPRENMVALVPIRDEKAFLGVLTTLQLKAEKGADDVYKVTVPVKDSSVPVYFRIVKKYVYVTCQKPDALAKGKLLDPAKLLAADPNVVASLTLHIDQIPDKVKKEGIARMEQRLSKLKEKKMPRETELERKLRAAVIDVKAKEIAAVINEGGELNVRLTIDQKTNDLVAEASLTAKPGTKLAAFIADQGKLTSRFAGLIGSDSAVSILGRTVYPEDLTKALVPLMQENARNHVEKVKDPAKREQLTKVMKALEPQFKTLGDADLAIDVRGPSKDKLYTVVAARNLEDGKRWRRRFPSW